MSVVVVIIVINLYFRLYSKALQADWALLPEATLAPNTSEAQKIKVHGKYFIVFFVDLSNLIDSCELLDRTWKLEPFDELCGEFLEAFCAPPLLLCS